MNAPLPPQLLQRSPDDSPAASPPANACVLRHVWQSRWGTMLIEVRGDDIFVNGHVVERHVG